MIRFAQLEPDAAAGRFGLGGATELHADAADEHRFRFGLTAHPGSVARARRLTRAQLTGWAVCEETCDTAPFEGAAARLEPGWKDTATTTPPELGRKGMAARPELGRMDSAARSNVDRKDTAARSDLGWSAKRPPAGSRGPGATAFWGTGTAWA